MILFVAPYAGELPENTPFLAAARKIRFLLLLLKSIDPDVVLLNSAHRMNERRAFHFEAIDLGNGELIEMATPRTFANPWVGRSINILQASSIVDTVVKRYGAPHLSWFYNGYAFESRVAALLKQRYDTKLVLEFEDWHFARNRGLNPKPWIDWYFWNRSTLYYDYAFAVNENLQRCLEIKGVPTQLLPGVISDWVIALREQYPPFSRPGIISVGYFGGLSHEKGAQFLLELMAQAKPRTQFVVTGKGELESDFAEFAHLFPDRLRFLGAVSDEKLREAVASVDVIVNAHEDNDGIFPFKVLEAVASGRLLISAPLPMSGYDWLKDAIEFRPPSLTEFLFAIDAAREVYNSRKSAIARAAKTAETRFGSDGLNVAIKTILNTRIDSRSSEKK